MNLTDFDRGWITGFIEGEGTFTINIIGFKRETKTEIRRYQYHNPAFYLVQKDRKVLEKIRDLLGMGKINRHDALFHLDIRKKSDVVRLAEFLDGEIKSELKTQQFERWKRRVLEWKSRVRGEGVVSTMGERTSNKL